MDYDDPFKRKKFGKIIPPHSTKRVVTQSGVFTIHPEPKKPFQGTDKIKLDKIIIDKRCRRDLKKILYRYGIHQALLFPNLDSLASHIEWMKRKTY